MRGAFPLSGEVYAGVARIEVEVLTMRWPSLQTRGCESHGGSDAELSGRRSTFRHGRDYVSITVPAFSERLDVNKLPSYHGRLPKTMKQVTIYRNWIQNLLQQGKIRKLPQKPRFTLPVRIVNERVTHDCRPLLPFITTDGRFPNLQSCWPIVTWAAQQPHLAKIDLKKAFHSIPLANDQIGAYAFELEGNYYAYMTMPMGATNAPKHFHQVMGIILSKLPFSHDIRYYQDDIFVAATDAKQLKQRYQRTIDYLMSQNFQINYDKSQLQCTDLLGYTLKNHTLSIPDQKWKRINELLHSNNLQLIQRAAQTLAYYKHTLNSNQQLTIQKLLTNKVKDSEILSIYSKALSSKPQMTFTTSAGEPLKLYLDTSNQAAGLVLKQANNTLLSASIPLPAVHNYANTNEAQGAYMLIKRYLSQIKDYVYTAKSELQVFSDNMLLAKALAGLSKITLGSETQYYARKIKILIATIKDTRTTYNYIQGKLNPADKPSRRTHKTQDTKWKATRQSNKHLAAKIFAHGTRSNFYHLFPKTNDKIKVDYKERNFQR